MSSAYVITLHVKGKSEPITHKIQEKTSKLNLINKDPYSHAIFFKLYIINKDKSTSTLLLDIQLWLKICSLLKFVTAASD